MNKYLKLLTNRSFCLSVLSRRGMLKWMTDEKFIKRKFKYEIGRAIDLDNPSSFNEKLQWLKLNDRKPIYSELVDKYSVRKHIEKTLGDEYLIPLIGGPWESFDEIDFSKLPDQFVLKCTHDSGGLVICRDKSKLNIAAARKKIERSLKRNYYWSGREWPYKNAKARIIAEMYMEDENPALGLTDYKFFCFNGEPKFIYVSQGLEDHSTASISFFDLEGNRMPFKRKDYKPIEGNIQLPKNFTEMQEYACILAKYVNAPFVRIDLYSIHGHVYFSEITFTPCNGFIPFEPKEWDIKLGNILNIYDLKELKK